MHIRLDLLEQMKQTLDQLVSNAKAINESVVRSLSYEQLALLQNKQEQIIKQLEHIDEAYQQITEQFPDDSSLKPIQDNIRAQIQLFAELNKGFVEKFKSQHSTIHFDDPIEKKNSHNTKENQST